MHTVEANPAVGFRVGELGPTGEEKDAARRSQRACEVETRSTFRSIFAFCCIGLTVAEEPR
jgi:hypothetical protein